MLLFFEIASNNSNFCVRHILMTKFISLTIGLLTIVYANSQRRLVDFPDTLNTSTKYYSPIFTPITKAPYWGILTIGQSYDSVDFDPYYKQQPQWTISETVKAELRNDDGLSIIIDTTQLVDCEEPVFWIKKDRKYYPSDLIQYYENGEIKSTKSSSLKGLTFKGYPVYILNLTDEEITLRYPKWRIKLIQEALNKNNQWIPIEQLFTLPKGQGLPFTVHTLKPGQFIITNIFTYKSDYQTQIRIKVINGDKIYYSKPFIGSINYSQILANNKYNIN